MGKLLRQAVASLGALLIGLAAPATSNWAMEPPKHMLMLDTGGHMGRIRDIVFTPDGRQVISASEDKTIRVWDLLSAKTVRTIRGEAWPGPAGKYYAIALSPDGKWLAAGGLFHPTDSNLAGVIRLYDFTSGALVALLKGHEEVVVDLAFSRDGHRLISGSSDKTARIWDIESRRSGHPLRGHTGTVSAVGFTPDGERAVTASEDHDLRLWRVSDGSEIALMKGHADEVWALAMAPDGTIASGDDSGVIRLWDGRDGRFRTTLKKGEKEERGPFGFGNPGKDYVRQLTISPDGALLLVSCYGICPVGVYDLASGEELDRRRADGSTNRFAVRGTGSSANAISPSGWWGAVADAGDYTIRFWHLRMGHARSGPYRGRLELEGGVSHYAAYDPPVVGFSKDSHRIVWDDRYWFELPTSENAIVAVHEGPAPNFELRELQTVFKQGPISVAGRRHALPGVRWPDIIDIRLSGFRVASLAGGEKTAYSMAPRQGIVIAGGSNGLLAAYSLFGTERGRFVGHEGTIAEIALSPDGRFLLSTSLDHTIRLWNLETRELVVTLFQTAESRFSRDEPAEWVMWTPEGFYVASENDKSPTSASKFVGWQINRGPDKEALYLASDQVKKLFNRPDLVAAKLMGDPQGKLRSYMKRLDIARTLAGEAAPEGQ